MEVIIKSEVAKHTMVVIEYNPRDDIYSLPKIMNPGLMYHIINDTKNVHEYIDSAFGIPDTHLIGADRISSIVSVYAENMQQPRGLYEWRTVEMLAEKNCTPSLRHFVSRNMRDKGNTIRENLEIGMIKFRAV